MSLLRQSAAGR